LADALKERFGVESTLIPGSGGVFDVVKDGELIYSKQKTGRFPEHAEIIASLNGQS
jgi:selenoprotein W-related protein